MHEVPPLGYAFDALEPHIDARTMEIHHDKHHAAYVTNLNKALDGHADLQDKSVEDLLKGIDGIPEAIRGAVRNHGGGHANHSLFWEIMGPAGGGEPSGELATAIERDFGGFDSMKAKLSAASGQTQGNIRLRYGKLLRTQPGAGASFCLSHRRFCRFTRWGQRR